MAVEVEAYSPAGVLLRTAAQMRKVAALVAAYMMAAGAHSPAGAMIHMAGAYSSAEEVYMPAVLQLHRLYAQVALLGW